MERLRDLDSKPLIPLGRSKRTSVFLKGNTIFNFKDQSVKKKKKTIHIYGDDGSIIKPRPYIKKSSVLQKVNTNISKEINLKNSESQYVETTIQLSERIPDQKEVITPIHTKVLGNQTDSTSPTDSGSIADSEEEVEALTSSRSSTFQLHNPEDVAINNESVSPGEVEDHYHEENDHVEYFDEDSAERVNCSQSPTYHVDEELDFMHEGITQENMKIGDNIETFDSVGQIEENIYAEEIEEVELISEDEDHEEHEEHEQHEELEENEDDNSVVLVGAKEQEMIEDDTLKVQDTIKNDPTNKEDEPGEHISSIVSKPLIETNVTTTTTTHSPKITTAVEQNNNYNKRHRISSQKELK
ncbi:uncharacterized protein RJT21DRAFT_4433 [Scheffersomyces amazonensis]|uniref:uncharacterized protein n=1 Tax=Scheffersomyces amazonensis TaxID=1078765 RepID=UPI00315D7BA3